MRVQRSFTPPRDTTTSGGASDCDAGKRPPPSPYSGDEGFTRDDEFRITALQQLLSCHSRAPLEAGEAKALSDELATLERKQARFLVASVEQMKLAAASTTAPESLVGRTVATWFRRVGQSWSGSSHRPGSKPSTPTEPSGRLAAQQQQRTPPAGTLTRRVVTGGHDPWASTQGFAALTTERSDDSDEEARQRGSAPGQSPEIHAHKPGDGLSGGTVAIPVPSTGADVGVLTEAGLLAHPRKHRQLSAGLLLLALLHAWAAAFTGPPAAASLQHPLQEYIATSVATIFVGHLNVLLDAAHALACVSCAWCAVSLLPPGALATASNTASARERSTLAARTTSLVGGFGFVVLLLAGTALARRLYEEEVADTLWESATFATDALVGGGTPFVGHALLHGAAVGVGWLLRTPPKHASNHAA